MSHRDADGRVLLFALVAALLIGLVAWGPGIGPVVHASRLNQTIPTPTPQGRPTSPPSNTARPPRPTEPGIEATATQPAAPPATGAPDQATSMPVTEEATTPVTEPETATVTTGTPGTGTAVPSPTAKETEEIPGSRATPQTPEAPASAGSTAVEPVAATGPAPTPSAPAASAPQAGTPGVDQGLAAETSPGGLKTLSYLWLAGGLVLIGAGIFVLLGRRRAG